LDTPGGDARTGIVAPAIASRSAPGIVATRGMSFNANTGRMRHQGVGSPVCGAALQNCERRTEVLRHGMKSCVADAVSACAMLVRRDVFDTIGLFDEDYFFSFEDLDFCLRARRAGFLSIVANDATAYHEGSRSIGARAPERLYYAVRNHLLAASRAVPLRSPVRHMSRVASIVLLNVAHAVIADGPSLPRRIAAVLRGTRDYALNRFGAAGAGTRPARPTGADRPASSRTADACCATDEAAGPPRVESPTRA
jgi:GT2 family glycosyltransferase